MGGSDLLDLTSNERKISESEAFRLSDLLIRSDYFKEIEEEVGYAH